MQETCEKNEKILEQLRSENTEIRKKMEEEEKNIQECLECEVMKEKVKEIADIKNNLKKAEEESEKEKKLRSEILSMFDKNEKRFNEDRIRKEKEIIEYKNKIRILEDEMRCLYIKIKDLDKLHKENKNLNLNIEEMKLQNIKDLDKLREENRKLNLNIEEMKLQNDESIHTLKEGNIQSKLNVKEKKNDVNKEIGNQDKMEADSSHEIDKQMKRFNLLNKENSKRRWEVSSSDSECVELLLDKNLHTVLGATQKRKFPFARKDMKPSPAAKQYPFSNPKRLITNTMNAESRMTKKDKPVLVISNSDTKHTDFDDFLSAPDDKEPFQGSPWIKRRFDSDDRMPSTPTVRRFFKTPILQRHGLSKLSKAHTP